MVYLHNLPKITRAVRRANHDQVRRIREEEARRDRQEHAQAALDQIYATRSEVYREPDGRIRIAEDV